MIKSEILCGSKTSRLIENVKRKLKAMEMDVFRRSARITRLDIIEMKK